MSKIRRKEGLELKKNLPGYLLMAPAVIAVLALSVYPLFRGIYLSFLNYNLYAQMILHLIPLQVYRIILIFLKTKCSYSLLEIQ